MRKKVSPCWRDRSASVGMLAAALIRPPDYGVFDAANVPRTA